MENSTSSVPRRRGRPPVLDDASPSETSVARPDMRADVREEDSVSRAARRAAELRGHLGDMDQGNDEFYVDTSSIPDGWTYEWKRKSILGAEDTSHTIGLARMGWEAVPAYRHPEMMPAHFSGNTIERKGLILMERPTEIVEEVRRLHNQEARKQVRDKEAQLSGTPDGTLTRDHEQVRPKIKKGWEALPVAKE